MLSTFDFDGAIRRIPRWMALVGATGTAALIGWRGMPEAGGFLAGALASWVNFRLIERVVNRLAGGVQTGGKRIFIQFAFLLLGAFAILSFSGFSLGAGLAGFLVCPAAVILEILYELITYGHS